MAILHDSNRPIASYGFPNDVSSENLESRSKLGENKVINSEIGVGTLAQHDIYSYHNSSMPGERVDYPNDFSSESDLAQRRELQKTLATQSLNAETLRSKLEEERLMKERDREALIEKLKIDNADLDSEKRRVERERKLVQEANKALEKEKSEIEQDLTDAKSGWEYARKLWKESEAQYTIRTKEIADAKLLPENDLPPEHHGKTIMILNVCNKSALDMGKGKETCLLLPYRAPRKHGLQIFFQ